MAGGGRVAVTARKDYSPVITCSHITMRLPVSHIEGNLVLLLLLPVPNNFCQRYLSGYHFNQMH